MEKGAIYALIGACGTLCGILFGVLTYRTNKIKMAVQEQKVVKQEGHSYGSLMSDVGYIKSGIDDLKRKQEIFEGKINDLKERIVRCEESTKSAHHRIDSLAKG